MVFSKLWSKLKRKKQKDEKVSWIWKTQKLVLTVLVGCFLASIPWEFVRLYQIELSKKAAITVGGIPDECIPRQQMTTWQSLKGWARWQLSWSHDPCEQYHRALLVDPFWEVTPMMVLSSSFTRCITTPLEILASGIGQAMRNLFAEIPATWQPIIMITLIVLLILSVFACSGYKLTLPFWIKLEPAAKNQYNQEPSKYESSKDRKSGQASIQQGDSGSASDDKSKSKLFKRKGDKSNTDMLALK